MSLDAPLIDVQISAIRPEAEGMKLFELSASPGARLPAAEAGAHIDVHLPTGLVRQYSLVRPALAPSAYLIGVKREEQGGGGSRWLHDEAREGQALKVSAPRNHFVLRREATHSILIAGGIGITPIWAMAQTLNEAAASWELHYAVRSQSWCAFQQPLQALGSRVHLYFDDVLGPNSIEFPALAAKGLASAGTHLYCCGPQGMLRTFEAACAELGSRAHVEHFAAPVTTVPDPLAADGFSVRLAKSGREIWVPAGETILKCLMVAGIKVPFSCTQGVCGSCETRVLEGVPEHHDVVLTAQERDSNKTMMVCCSRSKTSRLTLDL